MLGIRYAEDKEMNQEQVFNVCKILGTKMTYFCNPGEKHRESLEKEAGR